VLLLDLTDSAGTEVRLRATEKERTPTEEEEEVPLSLLACQSLSDSLCWKHLTESNWQSRKMVCTFPAPALVTRIRAEVEFRGYLVTGMKAQTIRTE
jgi:hypothetical protein